MDDEEFKNELISRCRGEMDKIDVSFQMIERPLQLFKIAMHQCGYEVKRAWVNMFLNIELSREIEGGIASQKLFHLTWQNEDGDVCISMWNPHVREEDRYTFIRTEDDFREALLDFTSKGFIQI